MADGAENADAAIALLFSTIDTIHEAFIVYAVSKPKLMANFVAHDGTATHQEILLSIIILNPIESWVIPAEREGTNTLGVASPPEAEVPAGSRIQVSHSDAEHGVGVSWSISN